MDRTLRGGRWAVGVWLAALVWAGPARADYFDHFVVRDDVGLHKGPSQGEAKVLLIPVEVAGFPSLDRAVLEQFFGPGEGGFEDYYVTASLGRFHPHVTVGPTVTFDACPLSDKDFPGCVVPRGDLKSLPAGLEWMREVLRRADAAGVDFSEFDVNGRKGVADGWVDGVMVLLNTPFGGVALPFAYFNQGDNLAGATGGAAVLDGVKVSVTAIAGNSEHRVLLHEFGHVLGLTDLYDEVGNYDGLNLSWMGSWSYGPKVPLPDAESRMRLRWGNWHQVQGAETVVLRPSETSGDFARIGTGDEYFLVENRGPGKFDADLSVRGLAVYHVDRKVKLDGREGQFIQRLLDCVECDPWHPYIRLQQADGRYDVELGGPFKAEEDLFRDGASFSSAESVLYSGAQSGFTFRDVKVKADGSIELHVEAPAEGQCGDTLCESGEGCAPATCGPQPTRGAFGCGATQAAGQGVGTFALTLVWLGLARRHRSA